MATVPESSWNNAANASGGGASTSLLNFVTGTNSAPTSNGAKVGDPNARASNQLLEKFTLGPCFGYALKFTTSEDEDEGKPEPATAFWTMYGRQTTIGNGGPASHAPDDICRRMDDS
eukprot:CAMPEP_0170340566 /NCGR_PEP_ID=MMETSP0116_2-20130129/71391_1 /TAXON_ID=400756 /ORGANISM="Durinskia baltica, Strain CSIRO CS-38" /LENGTH=116 /DNA_ID=CAMNT_0010594085 /DNA_START=452 /DNA_END=797 /DNA_ORIENTATION=-